MDDASVRDFFASGGEERHFHQVLVLHERDAFSWEELSRQIPALPRGWFELARLPSEDRIEFTYEYWQAKLPFAANESILLEKSLGDFFSSIEEIGIYATQSKQGGPFEVHMVYSLQEEMGFFHGCPPATNGALEALIKTFGTIHFPADYLAFLKIHDGFSKYTDTGLIKTKEMAKVYQRLQHLLVEEVLIRPDGEVIEPQQLIPFYESFGLHCYQCFYAGWHPEGEMGNLYFSEYDRAISNFSDSSSFDENLAFPSFIRWLIFYLEDIWHP